MADFSDLLVKIANNHPLTPGELDDLSRFGRDTQQRNSFIGGNTTPSGVLNVGLPFVPIFSEVLEADTASITIPTPGGYKHLILTGSGRTTVAGTASKFLFARVNGDSSSTYVYQGVGTQAATHDAVSGTSLNGLFCGVLNDAGQTAGLPGTFFSIFPHYGGGLFKTCLSMMGWASGSDYGFYSMQSIYPATSKIEELRLIPASGSIAAGAVISLYGVQ